MKNKKGVKNYLNYYLKNNILFFFFLKKFEKMFDKIVVNFLLITLIKTTLVFLL